MDEQSPFNSRSRDEVAAALEAEKDRLARKAQRERMQRQRVDRARMAFEKLFASGRAAVFLTQATRYMSRRGGRTLRRLAEHEDPRIALQALRLLNDSCRSLAEIRLAEARDAVRAAREDAGEDRMVVLEWPEEGTKG